MIILAAGKGTRMGSDLPKPLVEVSGRPIINHLLESISDANLDDRPIIVVGSEGLSKFHEVCHESDCEYVVQEEQLGTGHAVQVAQDAFQDADQLIVLYGDHPFISADTLGRLSEAAEENLHGITMMTAKVPKFKGDYEVFEHWARILRDSTGSISGLREYKDATNEEREIKEVNPAIFVFPVDWLTEHLEELNNDNASGEYYLTDLIEMAVSEGLTLKSIEAENPFEVIGINTPDHVELAERVLG